MSTGKYVEIAESLASNRVSGFVDIFADYGGNSKAFALNVKDFSVEDISNMTPQEWAEKRKMLGFK